jgi:hypothetical protein
VARALRRDHADVDALGRGDVAEADVEAVGEEQRVAGDEVRGDLLGVQLPLVLVGSQDHDQVGLFDRIGDGEDAQALGRSLLARRRTLLETDPHVDAGVAQAQRVRVALRAVADDGDRPVLDDREVGVVVVEHRCCHVKLFLLRCETYASDALGLGGLVVATAVRDRASAATEGH